MKFFLFRLSLIVLLIQITFLNGKFSISEEDFKKINLTNEKNGTNLVQQKFLMDEVINIKYGNKTVLNNLVSENKIFTIRSINEINTNNDTDLCYVKTLELLNFLKNPFNSTNKYEDVKKFMLYSGNTINDFGEYSTCINDKESNYILTVANISNIFINIGLCYYKECNSTDLEKSKNNLLEIINLRYKTNLTGKEVFFNNPKESLISYRESKITGLLITCIIMILIALISFIRLLTYSFKNIDNIAKNEIKINYQKLNEDKIKNSISHAEFNNENISNRSEDNYYKSKIYNFLKNFDLIQNTKAIFRIENNNKSFEYLRVFDGVRFLSTCWVLWGHVFFISMGIGFKNIYDVINKTEKLYYSILISGVISVDVFFYISGFLLYFNLKKYLKPKTNKILFFLISLFQRYIRLMPFYLIGIFAITNILPFLIDGPKNINIQLFLNGCEKYWWHNLLFLQNFFSNTYKQNTSGIACVPHSWYLADDMIYFIFSTIIILIVYDKRIIKNIIFISVFIGSCTYEIIEGFNNNYTNSYKNKSQEKGDFFNDFYIQPLARITPYMLGILYCELFFETDVYRDSGKLKSNNKDNIDEKNENLFSQYQESGKEIERNYIRNFNIFLKNNNNLCIFIFIISLLQIFYGVFIIWVPQNYDLGQVWQIFLITFNKIFFINGLGSLIHLIFLEKFSFIKDILTWSFFSVMSRITYGVYILHFYILMIFLYSSDNSFKIDMIELSFYAIGLMLISLICSFILGLLYESPVINLLKYIRTNQRREGKTVSSS